MQAVLLAAGRSTRFWPLGNNDHKSVYSVAGKPLLVHTLCSLAKTGLIDETFVVHAPHFSIPRVVPQSIGSMRVMCVEQREPKGTGDALYQVAQHITGEFVLVWPDMVNADFFVHSLVKKAQQRGVQAAMLGSPTKAPWNFGIIRHTQGVVEEIVEKPDLPSEPPSIKRIGVELLPKEVFSFYESLPTHHETDLIDALNEYAKKNPIVLVEQQSDVPVLKYPWDILTIMNILTRLFDYNLHKNLPTPDNVVFSKKSIIHSNSTFGDKSELRGPTYVGNNVRIGKRVRIIGPTVIEDNVTVGNDTTIVKTSVGERSTIGNNVVVEDSVIAPQCSIGDRCVINGQKGDKSVIESYVKDGNTVATGRRHLGIVMGHASHLGTECYVEPGVLLDAQCTVKDNTRLQRTV